MFVSRKNLPFIDLVPAEASPRPHMLQSLHQGVELLGAATSCCKLFQPFAEHGIERLMLRMANRRACSISCSSALRVMFFIRKQCTRYSCRCSPSGPQVNLVLLYIPHSLSPWGKTGIRQLNPVKHTACISLNFGHAVFKTSKRRCQ